MPTTYTIEKVKVVDVALGDAWGVSLEVEAPGARVLEFLQANTAISFGGF